MPESVTGSLCALANLPGGAVDADAVMTSSGIAREEGARDCIASWDFEDRHLAPLLPADAPWPDSAARDEGWAARPWWSITSPDWLSG